MTLTEGWDWRSDDAREAKLRSKHNLPVARHGGQCESHTVTVLASGVTAPR